MDHEAEQQMMRSLEEDKGKLKAEEEHVVPDPFSLNDGWFDEQ